MTHYSTLYCSNVLQVDTCILSWGSWLIVLQAEHIRVDLDKAVKNGGADVEPRRVQNNIRYNIEFMACAICPTLLGNNRRVRHRLTSCSAAHVERTWCLLETCRITEMGLQTNTTWIFCNYRQPTFLLSRSDLENIIGQQVPGGFRPPGPPPPSDRLPERTPPPPDRPAPHWNGQDYGEEDTVFQSLTTLYWELHYLVTKGTDSTNSHLRDSMGVSIFFSSSYFKSKRVHFSS